MRFGRLLLPLVFPASAWSAAAAIVEETIDVPVKVRNFYGRPIEHTIKVAVWRDSDREKSPFLVLNHGRAPEAVDRMKPMRPRYAAVSRYFVSLGFAVLLPTRVGYGESGGPDVEESGRCEAKSYETAYGNSVAESIAALEAAGRFPYIDASRGLAVGQSFGGTTAVGLAAGKVAAIKATVSFAGGGGGNPATRPADPCSPERVEALFATYGKSAKVPTLWLYSENDRYWGPDWPRQWFAAFEANGGTGKFVALPAYKTDGHGIFTGNPAAWKPAFEAFIREQGF